MLEVTGANAASLGAGLDTETLKDLFEAGELKIKQKNGIARTLLHLEAAYGKQTFLNFPKPGSKAKDHASNVLTDLGPWGDEGKTISWYNVFYSGSPQGRKMLAEIKAHNEAKASADNEARWIADKAALDTRFGSAVTRLKDAVKLNIQLYLVNNETEMFATIVKDGDEVIPSTKCIFVRNEDGSKFKSLTIGQFMGIDVPWAVDQKDGATYDNVVKSMNRGSDGNKNTGFKVSNANEFDAGIAAMSGFLTKVREPENEKAYRAFLSHLNEADNEYLLLSLDNFSQQIETYLELPSVKERLLKAHEAGGLRNFKPKKAA